MSRAIERLGDRQAIRDVLARYWRGIDRCDPSLVLAAYHPGAYDDHGYYKGDVEGFVDTLAEGVWSFFRGTQHFSGHIATQLSEQNPDLAFSESYAEAHHLLTQEDGTTNDLVYGLRYVDRFERRRGEWRIAHRVCTWDWHRIDSKVGLPLPESYFRGARDASDPSFEHAISCENRGKRVSPEDLLAKQACADALARYARGVDRCDPELIRSAYHPDAYDDHGGYQGDIDGFIAWVKETVTDAFQCTMHKLGNSLIELDGDQAYAETYAVAHHIQAPAGAPADASDLIMGVRYLDRLERRSPQGEWKIAHRVMSFEWERQTAIAPQVFRDGYLRGLRDGSDPVLAIPANFEAPASEQSLEDRAAIYEQLVRYCRGVDRRDEALLRSTYHEDAYDDHGEYKGDLDGFISFVKEMVHANFRTTMHKLGNVHIQIDGNAAHSESYAVTHHIRAEGGRDVEDIVIGIRYLDRFEKRGGEWRIARRELRYEWQRNEPLQDLDPSWTLGAALPADAVYQNLVP